MSRRTAFRDAESRGSAFAGEQRRAAMRNKLLATVAVAAVVGFGGFAAAQSQMSGESNKATPGASSGATRQKSGGGMSGAQSGPSRNQSAQEKSGKTNE